MPEAKTIMRRFQLNEISAVTTPAQEHAKVAFFKAADGSGFDKGARPGVMTKFRINELSGVDNPAQAGATVAILKAASPPEGDDPGLPEVSSRADLVREVKGFGRHAAGDRPKVKAHLVARAKALGSTDALPDSWATAAQEADPDNGADAEDLEGASDVDKAIKAMAKRGAAIRKAAGDDPGADSGTAGDPDVADVDWDQLKVANLGDLAAVAKKRAAATGVSYAKAYADVLASPAGAAAYAIAR